MLLDFSSYDKNAFLNPTKELRERTTLPVNTESTEIENGDPH